MQVCRGEGERWKNWFFVIYFRVLDNKQIIKQYCGPKIKSEKRKFSAVEQPVVISTAVLSQNDSPAPGSTVKGNFSVEKVLFHFTFSRTTVYSSSI